MKDKIACSGCGLIVHRVDVDEESISVCPRCKTTIESRGMDFSTIIALAFSALILYVPAVSLPLLTAEVGGILEKNSLLTAVGYFFQEGYVLASGVLLFTTVLIPIILILSILTMLIPIHFNRFPYVIKVAYKLFTLFHYWVRFDVYILSMIVASVKLEVTTELLLGSGMTFFLLEFILMFFLLKWFEPYDVWRKIEKSNYRYQ